MAMTPHVAPCRDADTTWARHTPGRIVSALVAALVLVVLSLSCAPAQAVPLPRDIPEGRMSMNASVDAKRVVTVTGQLSTQAGQPVWKAWVAVRLDDQDVARAQTGRDGTWKTRFTLPRNIAVGDHDLLAVFNGAEAVGSATAQAIIRVSGQPATTLTASPSTTKAGPGDLITITGRLTLTDSTPVEGAEITASGSFSHTADSTTPTAADGTFTTYLQVPLDATSGTVKVTVAFGGDSRFKGSRATFTVAVEAPTPTPTPSATPSDSPTPEPSETPEPGSTPTPSASPATVSPTPSPAAAPPRHTGLMEWLGGPQALLVLAAVVAGLLVLALVGALLGLRRRPSRTDSPDGGRDQDGDRGQDGDGNSLFDD